MKWTDSPWWRKHGWTVLILSSAFAISFLIRTLYIVPLIQQWGPQYLYAGGSDSFYHYRVTEYIIANHTNLRLDPLLHYPVGAINPREPLFDWMNAILGILFAGLWGGNANVAAAWFLDFQAPFWAALGVLPVYLIGREASSRRMGLVAALLYTIVVASIDSSTFGYANYLSFYTFFILVALYAYFRTLKAAGSRRWIEDYRQRKQYWPGLRNFLRTERTALKWSVFTGVALGAVTLAWQGYSFLIAAMVVFLVVQMIIERIRRVDSFSIYVLTLISGTIGFAMALPYYYFQGLGRVWFFQPALVFFGAILILLPFLLLRDTPWVISVPALLVTAGVAIAALAILDPNDFSAIVTGQGYFVKTLVYSTVAEAQAPSIDSLILGYGVVTFFLAFVGLALFTWRTVRDRFRRVEIMFIVFAILSVYLPISAAKFFFIGSAGFALLPAEAIVRLIDAGGFGKLRKDVVSLADRRSQFNAFRRSVKVRHVLILALVIVVVAPNIWYSIDAGIPYNTKGTYSTQIYDSLPVPLRTDPANASSFYLGADGTELDTPNQYDEAGYNWLATQDTQIPEDQRPALISWWDYGFQTIAEGDHPAVADNFQNGIDPSGNFLLSQNESNAIGVLATTLLAGEQARTSPYLTPALNAILARDGVNVATVHNLMVNTTGDVATVIAHPDRYLPVDSANLDGQNAMYDTMSYYLATTLSTNGVSQLYNDVQAYTGWSIRYAMVDSRLFPFSGSNTGIFYAPADLTDRVIGAGGAPTAYYTLSVLGSDGNTYSPSDIPAGVTAVQYNINYLPAFYNSMIYRVYVGYNGTDIGQAAGIPGLTNNAVGADSPEPGWMLSHFQVVYRTAYECDQPNATIGTSCFNAMNVPTAVALAKATNGTSDTSTDSYYGGGEAVLEYYPGQTMTGAVTLPDGSPVSGARVTVYDSWGIPHQSVVTGSDGAYSVVLPPGNDRINVTTGTFNGLTQAGGTRLAGFNVTVPNAVGLSLDAPTVVQPILVKPATVNGFVYWNAANNSTYIRAADPVVSGAVATLSGGGLANRTATTDASGSFQVADLAPGVYNLTVTYDGGKYTEPQVYALPGQAANQTLGLSPGKITGHATFPSGFAAAGATVTVSNGNGFVRTATADSDGNFTVENLIPGNYTVEAMAPGVSLGSVGTVVSIAAAGDTETANLTLVPLVSVSVPVLLAGNPVAGLPVRFTEFSAPTVPLPPGTNNSTRQTTSTAAKANSSVAFTGPDGVARIVLPAGNYSIYAFGLNGSRWYAGFTAVDLSGTPDSVVTAVDLAPAVELSGSVSGVPSTSVGPASTEITLYGAGSARVSTFANTTGGYSLWLPAGPYSVLADAFVPNSTAPPSVFLGAVQLTYPTVFPIALGVGQVVTAVVGVPASGSNGVYAAAGANVTFTERPSGAWVSAIADASGDVSVVLPATLPSGSTFCLSATAAGFEPYDVCSYTPTALASLGVVPMELTPVPVNVTVSGLPSGTSMTLNFTAVASPAVTTLKVGGPTFRLALVPGSYRLSGWAKESNHTGLFLPAAPVNVSLPVGTSGADLSLRLVAQVVAKGTLVLPAGVTNTTATVSLSSSTMNLTLNGAGFASKFYVAPGTYRVFASAPNGGNGTYTTITTLAVNATGHLSASLYLTQLGVALRGTLTNGTGGLLNVSVTLTFTAPGGVATTVHATDGQFTTALPGNATYQVTGTATVLLPGASTNTYVTVTVPLTFSGCVLGAGTNATCAVPFAVSTVTTPVSGSLHAPGFSTSVPATVELIGPYPSTIVTTVDASNGSFSATLVPGNYTLYAVATTTPYANISVVEVGTTPVSGLSVGLIPGWTDTVTVVPPATSPATSLAIVVTAPGGTVVTFPNEPTGSGVPILLPPGLYNVSARALGDPYGVPVNASAYATVALMHGNAATTLTLAYAYAQTVRFTTLPPVSSTVRAGGTVTFAYSVINTGNEPENLTFVGSPSFWNMTFAPSHVVLGVLSSNDSVGGEVRIVVPAGTNTETPSVQLEVENSVTKQPVGFASPVPTITIVPVVGLSVGPATSVGASVSPYYASVPFYILNNGNLLESTTVSVADSVRLTGLGWTPAVEQNGKPLAGPAQLAAGSNTSFAVVLTSPTGHALLPGSITVTATVGNLSGGVTRTVVLSVPTLTVGLNNSTAIITGPNLGSPSTFPSWAVPTLVFVPTVALVVGFAVYRWWKTRRWTRR
jgi:dolichyl-diphosphooligosaccharide--protein glycosyltransferase